MSLIPTSNDLESQIQARLEGISDSEKEEWLSHPCSEALAILFETIRMQALEALEAGANGELGAKLAGQAALAGDLGRYLTQTIMEKTEDDSD